MDNKLRNTMCFKSLCMYRSLILLDMCFPAGNRMFSFREEDVDFYLPQLINMYIQMHDVAEAIHPYLVHR